MEVGFFTMPIHPINKDYKKTLSEDREAFLLADKIGFSEAYCGEHVTDAAENITSSALFIASLAAETKKIRLYDYTFSWSFDKNIILLIIY